MNLTIYRFARAASATATLVSACLLAGCGSMETVQPWQKGWLAQPAMRFDGERPQARYAAHIYDSKEAASGAGSVGGGGCGCN
ncbi:MAG: DUF4266 domain-containing protein [Sphingomonadaceae bacterium]